MATFENYYLEPEENQISFYKKAEIREKLNKGGCFVSQLYSYDTLVCEYAHEMNNIKVFGYFSQTTGRHINSFLMSFGFDKITKKEMENKPVIQGELK